MRIKSLPVIGAQWVTRVTASAPQYKAGVQNPREDWATATVAGKDNYAAGVQAALSNGSFEKGVQRAGSAKWSTRTLTIGAPRWIQGVTAGHAAYGAGFSKYHQIIAGLTLPPRGPAGSPQNIARVTVISEALHAAKLAGGA
jgi:hypothetical protein